MKRFLRSTCDVVCILLDLAFLILSLPFRIAKGIFDIADIIRGVAY